MAPASNEEQFKFLISCIRYSNNGKVDFGRVAAECKIVSKGAAAKRYERMMRAHGIAANPSSVKQATSRVSKTERGESGTAASKKRKADQFLEQNSNADDDENFVKQDPSKKDTKEQLRVKEEDRGQMSMNEAADLMQYYDNSSYTYSSPLGAEQKYEFGGSGDYVGSSMSASSEGWGMGSSTPPCNYVGTHDSDPRASTTKSSSLHNTPYRYLTEGGGAETPLIVE